MWSELQNMTSWMKSWDWKLLLALVPCTNRVFKVSNPLKCWPWCSPRDSGLVWWVWHSRWEQVDAPCDHSPSGEAMKDRVQHTSHLDTIQDDFQYYRNHRSNSWVSEGALHVMPTLTASEYGEDFLHSGCIDLNKEVSQLSQPGTCHLSKLLLGNISRYP